MKKKILALVRNGFTNDARVDKTLTSLSKAGYKSTLFAEKSIIGLPIIQKGLYSVIRIPLFSSLYKKKKLISTKINISPKVNQKSVLSSIKNNKIRIWFVVTLNTLIYNFVCLVLGIIYRPKIIYANDLDTLTVGFLISKLTRASLIYDSHEIWLEGNRFNDASKLKQIYWLLVEKHTIGKCEDIITTTEMRAKHLENKYQISNVQIIRNCPNFVEIEYHNLFREEFPIEPNSRILLYQGLLNIKRGILTLVNIVEKIPDIVLVIMGEGRHSNLLRKYINDKGLQNRVFLKDMIPYNELLNYSSSADIGLQLLKNTCFNHYSAISNKLFEYIMSGLAIVASDFPEIKRIVSENDVGLVVDPDNESEIIANINKILVPEKLELYKLNSRRIRKELSWENEEKLLLKMVNEL